jgi:hypothetical protein
MPTPRALALDQLWQAQKASGGITVTYRAGRAECELVAVPARTVAELDLGDGVIRTARVADFVVTAGDLLLDGVNVRPELGDQIVVDDQVYEVMNLVGGQHFQTVGMSDSYWRIHTREVADV